MFSKVPSCAFSGFWTLTLKLTQHFDLIYNISKSDWKILQNIMKTAQYSYTITIKQIVRFQERMHLEKFQVDKIQNGRLSPLFTSTGLILQNIMKTAQDSYTITIKQIVMFQERMHLEKFQVDKIQNGRLSAIIYLEHHYYKTNCKVTGEDAFWKKFHLIKCKMADSLSHGRYLVNPARWLDHYYKTKCVISGEDASWKNSTR